jgi:hypothetical protein
MTKVRVSEDTPNLNHPSNLISIVRLENPSPSLMRSTRARGRTHSWVVHSFLVERARESWERSSLRRETAFVEGEHASQGKEQHGFRGSRQQGRTSRTVRISEGRTTINVHNFRGRQQQDFLRVLARIPRLPYSVFQA